MSTGVLITLIVCGTILAGLIIFLLCALIIYKKTDKRMEESMKEFEKNFRFHDFD